MDYFKTHKKTSIVLLIFLSLTLIVTVAYGKYFYNILNDYILETKKFYFNSSVLASNEKRYQINNWDGVSSYYLTIDLNNRKNDEKSTDADITYDVFVECGLSLTCTTSATTGTIRKTQHTSSYQITVTPNTPFTQGEQAVVRTYVKSTSPYVKTLSATYYLNVTNALFSYDIVDNPGELAFNLNLTNSVAYYEVQRAFGSYAVGDKISADVYETLTDIQKSYCYSAIVTLTFDPRIVLLDSTDESIKNRLSTNYQTTTISGKSYVSKYSFKVDASTNKRIVFYKNNPGLNYTYPTPTNTTSIITVDVQLPQD